MPFKIRRVLIVEDIDSIMLGLTTLLRDLPECVAHTSKTSQEAIRMIESSITEQQPYDLIITDLAPIDNAGYAPRQGIDFVEKIKLLLPATRIIIYSAEKKPFLIYRLFINKLINGFIAKDRDSLNLFPRVFRLFEAGHSTFISPQLQPMIDREANKEIEDYDIMLLELLAVGNTQSDISAILKERGATSSVSSIEKRINRLKILLEAQNTIHLIAIAKDTGII